MNMYALAGVLMGGLYWALDVVDSSVTCEHASLITSVGRLQHANEKFSCACPEVPSTLIFFK